MCGIVGYIGSEDKTIENILEGLKKLEYRGYDSAGISIRAKSGEIFSLKKEGKLKNLTEALKGIEIKGPLGIGHTRWATHGKPNDQNAHPHTGKNVSLVHNGIIENANLLRTQLSDFLFESETDTEVFLALMEVELAKNKNFLEVLVENFKKIKGNSAFVLFSQKEEKVWAVKRSNPLVCGINETTKEVFVSSDPYTLVENSEKLFFPDDNTICCLEKGKISFYNLEGKACEDYVQQEVKAESTYNMDKAGFKHYMLKEIHEQPGLIRNFAEYYLTGKGREELKHLEKLNPLAINIIACGTAWHAGLVAQCFIERYNRIPVTVDWASEFRYKNPILSQKNLSVLISQSGETADTLAAQKLCQEKELKTLALVNTPNSSIHRGAEYSILTKAEKEIGVASTKAFTLQALSGLLLSRVLKGSLDEQGLKKKIFTLAERIAEVVSNCNLIQHIAQEIYNKKGFIFTGRGAYYPIALEGALKLKEIAYVHAEGYASGELKHGPIALFDETMVNIAILGSELYDKTLSNIEEVKARKGIIVIIGPVDQPPTLSLIDHFIPVNLKGVEELAPLVLNVVNQLLSYYIADFKGTDIDMPRNLAKSVTVE